MRAFPKGSPLSAQLLAARARSMRFGATESEARLWAELRGGKLGVRFRRQVPLLGRYVADSDRVNITQDGRHLRRYKRRWKVERFFAWLFNFRRLVVRYERHPWNFFGFLHLACAIILLRHL